VEVVVSLSQGRTAAAQCDLFTHKSVPVIFEPPCITVFWNSFRTSVSDVELHIVEEVFFYNDMKICEERT